MPTMRISPRSTPECFRPPSRAFDSWPGQSTSAGRSPSRTARSGAVWTSSAWPSRPATVPAGTHWKPIPIRPCTPSGRQAATGRAAPMTQPAPAARPSPPSSQRGPETGVQEGAVRADNSYMEGNESGAREEAGFTILELIAALTVLAVALFGIAAVFDASIRTSDLDVRRTEAVSLSVQAVESLRAVPYAQLGLPVPDGAPADACHAGASGGRATG